MKKNFTLAIAIIALLASCRKDHDSQSPAEIPPPRNDTRSVLLRDMNEQNMPSPFYHFTYNDSNYVTGIEFASGFFVYEIEYKGGRISKMFNTRNGSSLNYHYQDGQVASIVEIDITNGKKLWRYSFDYTGRKLRQVQWHRFVSPTDSVLERKITLQYFTDGNLSSLDDFRRNNNQLAWSTTTQYSAYDNKQNVDDFQLFKSFFEHLLFLPQVKLQKNNPAIVTITGPVNEFRIDYTYKYQGGLPVEREGILRQTKGGGNTQPVSLQSSFSYY